MGLLLPQVKMISQKKMSSCTYKHIVEPSRYLRKRQRPSNDNLSLQRERKRPANPMPNIVFSHSVFWDARIDDLAV